MCVFNGHYSGIEIAVYNPPGAEKRARERLGEGESGERRGERERGKGRW